MPRVSDENQNEFAVTPPPKTSEMGLFRLSLTGHCTLSMLFTDWNRSGQPSLRISNDRHYYVRDGEDQLWHMGAVPRLYGREDGWEQLRIFGMGIASYDVTGDGYPEYMLTSMADNKLRTLKEGADVPTYTDLAYARGVTAHVPHVGDDERPSTAWHPEFGDVDNDGLIDLFITKGNVEAMPEAAALDPNNLLMGSSDGRFVERSVEAGVASMAKGRGASLIDLGPGRSARSRCRQPRLSGRTLPQSERGDRQLAAGPSRAVGAEPERYRRLDRGERRCADMEPRSDGGRRPRERRKRMDPLRPG